MDWLQDKKMTSLKIDKWSYNCTNYRRKFGCVLKKRYCCPEKCIKYTPICGQEAENVV